MTIRRLIIAAVMLVIAGAPAVRADEPPADLSDLPLVDVLPRTSPVTQDMLVVILTGDGGWRDIDRELGDFFAKLGYPVVGVDSLKYYWTPRTPEAAAADLARILRDRMPRYRSQRVLLVGYSFGADVAAFLANRLPEALRAKLWRVGLLAPSADGDFEIGPGELLGGHSGAHFDNVAEVKAAYLKGTPVLCLEGEQDKDAICDMVALHGISIKRMAGGHHFFGRYQALGEALLAEVAPAPAAPTGPAGFQRP